MFKLDRNASALKMSIAKTNRSSCVVRATKLSVFLVRSQYLELDQARLYAFVHVHSGHGVGNDKQSNSVLLT